MNFEPFYMQCQQLPEKDEKCIDLLYKTISEVFGGDKPQFGSPDKICKLFYGKGRSVSKSQYYRKRKIIKLFYDWLYEQGAVDKETVRRVYDIQLDDVVTDYELSRYFFKDLNEVLEFIRMVGTSQGFDDPDDLLNIKAIVILLWYGVELSEIVGIKKSDLNRNDNTVKVGQKSFPIEPEHMSMLCRFSDIDIYKGFPSQKQQVYVSSPYLLRSAKQPLMIPNNVQCAFRRFNLVASQFGRELSVLNIRKNGVFWRVYTRDDNTKSINNIIIELTGCDTAFAFGYKKIYERWKCVKMGDDNK